MGLTLPPEYAEAAALVGLSAELFLWDEDQLERLAGTISTFLQDVEPGTQDLRQAATRFAAASGAFGLTTGTGGVTGLASAAQGTAGTGGVTGLASAAQGTAALAHVSGGAGGDTAAGNGAGAGAGGGNGASGSNGAGGAAAGGNGAGGGVAGGSAAGDAFVSHWTAMAGAGGADDVLRAAGWTAAALGFAAMAIRAAKTIVLARLAWCARQLALSTLGGPAGRLAGIANVLASRVAIGEIVRELGRRLRDVAVPVVRRAIALLREAAGRLRGAADTLGARLAGATPRPAYAGLPDHAPALDGTRMNMGRKKNDDDEGFSWLPKRNSSESHDKPGKSGQTCDYCGGSGDDPFKDGRTCPNCVGTGVNP